MSGRDGPAVGEQLLLHAPQHFAVIWIIGQRLQQMQALFGTGIFDESLLDESGRQLTSIIPELLTYSKIHDLSY